MEGGAIANAPITTVVMFHDLLGFGSALSASGGRFDSAIGQVAFDRILKLRETMETVVPFFPQDTPLFHYNDSVVATCDINMAIDFPHASSNPTLSPSFSDFLKLVRFLGAAARIHDQTISSERDERLGPGGRTFLCLGKRWDVPTCENERIQQFDSLHANLAFAEAYAADQAGSKAGFDHTDHRRLYVNDAFKTTLSVVSEARDIPDNFPMNYAKSYPKDFREKLELIEGALPEVSVSGRIEKRSLMAALFPAGISSIKLPIFHIPREFHAVNSNIAKFLCDVDFVGTA